MSEQPVSSAARDAVATDEPGAAEPAPPTARSGLLADTAWVLGTFAVLGLLGAVLWWLLVDPALFTKARNGGLAMGEAQLGHRFATDGWFVVIALVLGLLAGTTLTWWRSRDVLATSALVAIGSILATAVMAVVGRLIGPADPASLVATVGVGDRVPVQLAVTAPVAYLVWPLAVLAGTLFVLWSPPTESVR